jgi:hypothetical protein
VVKGRSGVPLSPDDLAPSNFMDSLQAEDYLLHDNGGEHGIHHSLDKNKSFTHDVLKKDHQASMSVDCSP